MKRNRALQICDTMTEVGAAVSMAPVREDGQVPENWSWEVTINIADAGFLDLRAIAKALDEHDISARLDNYSQFRVV